MNDNLMKEYYDKIERNKAEQRRFLDLNALSLHCNGQPFEQAPIEWQRMVEDMYKRDVRFEVVA
tara:strand:- start:3420 stop:3611 length:192 start_codon:yes stop_codon:yes gene_type:complete